ncbi:MAG TPA: type IV pilus modification protein PilV [Steroidobacteraceae bacterium]|jgi:type IV pilus assembly protein PilV|nr:type IV pilus modification protein PilV [Steroidobacteraceae bacterium]
MRPPVLVAHRAAGFSLVEVLVALIVIAVGMLGIAKMHALALSATASAGTRSLVALEAAGLASSIHANRDYWAATATLQYNVTVSGGAANVDVFPSAQSCTSTCTSTQMAAYDLQNFGAALAQIVPAANANISCQNAAPPESCTITVTWLENIAGLNTATSSTVISSAAVSSAPTGNLLQQPQYILYVEP